MQETYENITPIDPFSIWFYIFNHSNITNHIASHWHQGIEVSFTLSGQIERFTISGHNYQTTPGKILVVNTQQVHSMTSYHLRDSCLLSIIIPFNYIRRFYPDITKRLIDINQPTTFSNTQQLAYSQLQSLLYQFVSLHLSVPQNPLTNLKSQLLFDQILLSLLANFSRPAPTAKQIGKQKLYQTKRIQFITAYVERHFAQKLHLQIIADQCSISKEYLARFFKKQMGMSVNHYIANVRAQHARIMLLTSQKSLTQIALANGFASTKAMNQAFNNLYSVNASTFRHRLKNN